MSYTTPRLIAGLVAAVMLQARAASADELLDIKVMKRADYFARYVPDPAGVGGSIIIVIKSRAVADTLAKQEAFQIRVFRGARDAVRKSAWRVEKDCELFPSQLSLKFNHSWNRRVTIDSQLHWRLTGTDKYWLAYDAAKDFVFSQPYTFVLETHQDDRDFVVLHKDHIDAYFSAAFQITLDPPKTSLSQGEIKGIRDHWDTRKRHVTSALDGAKVSADCRTVTLQAIAAEDGTVRLQLAETGPCQNDEPGAL
jgi:hypothetical protein